MEPEERISAQAQKSSPFLFINFDGFLSIKLEIQEQDELPF